MQDVLANPPFLNLQKLPAEVQCFARTFARVFPALTTEQTALVVRLSD